jgi:inosose dehydratase
LGGLAAVCAASNPFVHALLPPAGVDHTIQFGAQTNAFPIDRNDFQTFLTALKQIRSVGYTGFETGFANVMQQFGEAGAARAQIEKTGLSFFGVHIYLPRSQLDPSTNLPPASLYAKVASGAAALGAQHLIFSAAPSQDASALERKIAALDVAGKFAKNAGVTLVYHNETAEESAPGLGELQALYVRTDPAYVAFLLDCGHAYQGGLDVPSFLAQHSARIVGLHLRDYKDGGQVVLGQGTFPLAEAARVLKRARWSGWVLNEEERTDGSKHGLEYIKPAFEATRKAFSQ